MRSAKIINREFQTAKEAEVDSLFFNLNRSNLSAKGGTVFIIKFHQKYNLFVFKTAVISTSFVL